MKVSIFHNTAFNSLVMFGRPVTLETAKRGAKTRTATLAEWKILTNSFSPKQSDKVEMRNILFYAEGASDALVIGQTGQGYLNGVGGIFDITALIKKADQRKFSLLQMNYLEQDALKQITVTNNTAEHFELHDQNGIFQGVIPPKTAAKVAAWPCEYILSSLNTPGKLFFNPHPYPARKTFLLQKYKVLTNYELPCRQNRYEPTAIEIRIV